MVAYLNPTHKRYGGMTKSFFLKKKKEIENFMFVLKPVMVQFPFTLPTRLPLKQKYRMINKLLCDEPNYTRILIGSYIWSIGRQTLRDVTIDNILFFIVSNKYISCCYFFCPVIDHKRRQHVVRTSVTHPAAFRVPLFCSYPIFT